MKEFVKLWIYDPWMMLGLGTFYNVVCISNYCYSLPTIYIKLNLYFGSRIMNIISPLNSLTQLVSRCWKLKIENFFFLKKAICCLEIEYSNHKSVCMSVVGMKRVNRSTEGLSSLVQWVWSNFRVISHWIVSILSRARFELLPFELKFDSNKSEFDSNFALVDLEFFSNTFFIF